MKGIGRWWFSLRIGRKAETAWASPAASATSVEAWISLRVMAPHRR